MARDIEAEVDELFQRGTAQATEQKHKGEAMLAKQRQEREWFLQERQTLIQPILQKIADALHKNGVTASVRVDVATDEPMMMLMISRSPMFGGSIQFRGQPGKKLSASYSVPGVHSLPGETSGNASEEWVTEMAMKLVAVMVGPAPAGRE